MAETIKIGNERFKVYTFSPRKSDADSLAKDLRAQGWKARVIKRKNGYLIAVKKGRTKRANVGMHPKTRIRMKGKGAIRRLNK